MILVLPRECRHSDCATENELTFAELRQRHRLSFGRAIVASDFGMGKGDGRHPCVTSFLILSVGRRVYLTEPR
jgi:hypothetical protein